MAGGVDQGGNGVHGEGDDGGEVEGGELLFCGNTDWSSKKGDKRDDARASIFPYILEPSRLASMSGIKIVHVAAGCASSHCVALDADGRCYTWGRNDNGQLGHGDLIMRNIPVRVSGVSKVKLIKAAAGRNHTVVVASDGSSYGFGQNKHGQLGTGTVRGEIEASPLKALVQDSFDVACGSEFTLWLTDVSLLSAGLPQYGQLGHGTDHEYNNASGTVKLVYEPQPVPRAISALAGKKIVKAACGTNHSVVIDSEGFAYTWGYGGHGRLGHREQKDEWKPRMLDVFKGTNKAPSNAVVGAGGSFSAVSAAGGQLYTWGRVKMTGDNIMYPKAFMGISGWTIRSLDCGSMTSLAAAESSCISWGTAQTGELGYGPKGPKSSALPRKIESLEGMFVHKVAAGVSHSLFIVDVKGEAKEKVEKLPVFESKAPEVSNESGDQDGKGGNKRKAPAPLISPAAKGAGRGRGKKVAAGKDKPVLKPLGSEDVKDMSSEDESESEEDEEDDSEKESNMKKAAAKGGRGAGRGRGRGRGRAAGVAGGGTAGGVARGRGRGRKKDASSASDEASDVEEEKSDSEMDGESDDGAAEGGKRKSLAGMGIRSPTTLSASPLGQAGKGRGRGRPRGRGRGAGGGRHGK